MIPQEHVVGCGVACVAARLGVSYTEALQLFEHPEHVNTYGFWCRELVQALARAGVQTRVRYVRKRPREYPVGTIIFIVKSKEYPAGHYLLKVEQGWMDSWINWPKIKPVRAGIRKDLPGEAQYAIISATIAA